MKARRDLVRFALLLPLLAAVPAVAQLPLESDYFLESPESVKYAVIVVGPSVGESNVSQFRQWGFSLHDILVRDYGYSADTITLLNDPDEAGPNPATVLMESAIGRASRRLSRRFCPGCVKGTRSRFT